MAIDARTGEIKAIIGGRDYGQSQLNHALAHRQPGSVFKPFVYAAAFNNAVDGAQPIVTPATTVDDEPTVFEFDGQEYTPNNYGERFMGRVTARQALTNSLNIATVKIAELVGYGRVVQVARQMGVPANMRPTPAVALGAYEMTPLEVAGAYTGFATVGTRAEPYFLNNVISANGNMLEKYSPVNKMVLDPRVAYLVDSVLQDVLNKGTGAAVRAKGFTLPAAGKTGTSRDGWFAGFTSNLVCVVWVGFDDNHDLGLTGGVAVAPIWADFHDQSHQVAGLQRCTAFAKPDGVDHLMLDSRALQVATPSCPTTREEVFVAGSQPTQLCELHGGHGPATASGSFLSHIFGGGSSKPPATPGDPNASPMEQATRDRRRQIPVPRPPRPPKRKRVHCRRFLVSLGARKRKSPRHHLGTKETRHDKAFFGDSGGKFSSSSRYSSPLVAQNFADNPESCRYTGVVPEPASRRRLRLSAEDMARLLMVRKEYQRGRADFLQADGGTAEKCHLLE